MHKIKVLVIQQGTPYLISTYQKLASEHNLKIEFRALSKLSFISEAHFRTYKLLIEKSTAFLFSNSTAIEYFFPMVEACNIALRKDRKCFLANQGLAYYIEKHHKIKKTHVYKGKNSLKDLLGNMKNHKKETFLFPCSNLGQPTISPFFRSRKHNFRYKYKELPIYSNEPCNLETINPTDYDLILFFSPIALSFFAEKFPTFDSTKTKVAVLGEATAKKAKKYKWQVAITPNGDGQSMMQRLDAYFRGER